MDTRSPVFESITLRNFLSYGPGEHTIPLKALNVLIGPNGSGKSNLVEAFEVLRGVPGDLELPIRRGGGVDDWLWNGPRETDSAELKVVFPPGVVAPDVHPPPSVLYRVRFGSEAGRFVVLDERIENCEAMPGHPKPYYYFGYRDGLPFLNTRGRHGERGLNRSSIDRTQSVLSQRKDPENYPEVARVGDLLGGIMTYRKWNFGPDSDVRRPCSTGAPTHRLEEDFSNLPARLSALQRDSRFKQRLKDALGEVAPGYSDFSLVLEGGRLQLYVTEDGYTVPAHRLSDGTLRYLCLLTILLAPGSATVVVIEEPELGLHPDMMPILRDALVEASARVQVVVTTHSFVLVDAMTHHADAVVICEKDGRSTRMHRLTQPEVDAWLESGSLGHLWISGRFGGTRW